ncbi:type II toxin-antitoxin system MqsR family toxin [Methylomicrobium sp. Wu6]|uniref:type II toxin-antitoxin system MqsR family toxin n=1 Tax=Methylomicrobium sp. Wu6 TaxID=3107928 RepID=UPI002DD62DEA|nr:type II toxin-antitoxin system MqsR family toxin [Methylomicrobium sp. Wu6]MEC4747450.1 type II toxin-antitoxin system MqsR family toxin [Methylomicrobium sp. Wu6]
MVNEYKAAYHPAYELNDIRQSAQQGKFRYEGRKVNSDIRNLGYTGEDVKRCIAGLTASQFQKSLQYQNAIYDVYICDYEQHDDAVKDRIYMKLRLLANGEIQVGIGSFHLA